ncbi:MAG: hypothetical protein QOH15_459 [Gaiellales bacterium]|jgi:hypothetical protein|nr:hypothetical protein [Gaiellales bacterium]
MNPDTAYPATPAIGSSVELRPEGGQPLHARVVDSLETALLLGELDVLPHPSTSLALRWFTPDTGAWEIDVEVSRGATQSGEIAVKPLGEHRAAGGRRALRLPAGRAALAAEAVTGVHATGKPIELILIDASATGVGAIGWGKPPAANDIFRLELGIVRAPRVIEGRVARLQSQPFGRWLVGFEFLPRSPDELEWLLAWRDAWVELVGL